MRGKPRRFLLLTAALPYHDRMFLGQTDSVNDWLTTLLFESPGWAIAVLALAWAIMRVGGRRLGNTKLMRWSWLPLGLLAALLVLSSMVTTKREQLPRAMDDLLLAVEDKDMDRFRELVTKDAVTRVFVRDMSRYQVEKLIREARINDLRVTSINTMIKGDSAATMVHIRADGEVSSMPGIQISRWLIQWRYVDGQWRAHELDCEAMGADAVFNEP